MTTAPLSPAQSDFAQALEHHGAGRLMQAAELYRKVIAANAGHVDALHLLGVITAQSGDPAEGERLIAAAISIKDDVPLIWNNHANVLDMLGRRDAAIASLDRALTLKPDFVEARYNRAGHQIAAGHAEQALADLSQALTFAPGHHVLITGCGNALSALERYEEAVSAYDEAIASAPRNVDAISGRGKALKQLGRAAEALETFDHALSLVPGHLDSLLGRGHALVLTGRNAEALQLIDRVVALVPGNAIAHYVRGHALLGHFRHGDALEAFQRSAHLQPDLLEAVYNIAEALRLLGRFAEAIPIYERVLARNPNHARALDGLATAAMQCCDWTAVGRVARLIEGNVRAGIRGIAPFTFLSLSSSKELQLACARSFASHTCPGPTKTFTNAGAALARRAGRIRLGYLSSDFRRHAMAYQMAELFEVHDRTRFEVVGFSGGPDDGSPIRQRIARSFDAFHDVAARTNEETARLVRECEVDIAIDLNGHTAHSRIGALAWRPARVQATYLGFPGTSGTPFIDYVLADDTVAPLADQPFFSECIVHLPGCYQVSDRQRKPSPHVPRRSDCGLPDRAFVFCCFNSSYKISSMIFDVWMRILAAVPGSVLWLVRSNNTMVANLRREAQARGVDATRLVFCDVVEPDRHLARHAVADLYLDTLPYNSHGTGSFALWAGLPMITCAGETFAGRVAASLLKAIDLTDLVTPSLETYEALALKLASDRALLDSMRRRLEAGRTTTPLFDTEQFRRNIEAAYTTMHEIALAGQSVRSFAVQPQP